MKKLSYSKIYSIFQHNLSNEHNDIEHRLCVYTLWIEYIKCIYLLTCIFIFYKKAKWLKYEPWLLIFKFKTDSLQQQSYSKTYSGWMVKATP